jgi:hypothetical protein
MHLWLLARSASSAILIVTPGAHAAPGEHAVASPPRSEVGNSVPLLPFCSSSWELEFVVYVAGYGLWKASELPSKFGYILAVVVNPRCFSPRDNLFIVDLP